MKISKVQIPSFIKNIALTAPLLFATNNVLAQNSLKQDVFEKSEKINYTDKTSFSPKVKIDGNTVYPAIVVDISEKKLYSYDLDGTLIDEFPVKLCEKEIVPGINTIEITKHIYNKSKSTPKIILSKVRRINGRVVNMHKQVIVGSEGKRIQDDYGIFTNVVLVDRDVAKKITKNLLKIEHIFLKSIYNEGKMC